MPDGVHSCRSHAVFGNELVEILEVAVFLIVHVLHERSKVRVRADEGWRLRRVYQNCCKFTSLIDAQGAVEEIALSLSERPALSAAMVSALQLFGWWWGRR